MVGMTRRWILGGVALAMALGVPLFALQEKPKEGPQKESRTAYVRRLFERDRASYADACRIILSLAKGEHTDALFADMKQELESRGIIDPSWTLGEGQPVTKGVLAFMLAKTLRLKGGVMVKIFGWSQRYAYRECLYEGLMTGMSDMEYVTGRDLLDVLANAGIYQEVRTLDDERK
jgi:hypothetical protein